MRLRLSILILLLSLPMVAQTPLPGEQEIKKVRFTDNVRIFNKSTNNTVTKGLFIDANNNLVLRDIPVGSSGQATWGSINGTLSNQTDLVNYINQQLISNVPTAQQTFMKNPIVSGIPNDITLQTGSGRFITLYTPGINSGVNLQTDNSFVRVRGFDDDVDMYGNRGINLKTGSTTLSSIVNVFAQRGVRYDSNPTPGNTDNNTLMAKGMVVDYLTSQKGQSNGIAELDVNSKLPLSRIPDSLLGALIYQTLYNVATNTPALPPASGNKGKYYVVSVGGTYNGETVYADDWLISNGTVWQVLHSSKVNSVNGKQGVVVLTPTDLGLGNVDNTSDLNKPISNSTQAALNNKANTSDLALKANLSGGNSFSGNQNIAGDIVIDPNKGIGFGGQIAMIYDSVSAIFKVFNAQTGQSVVNINPTTRKASFMQELEVAAATQSTSAMQKQQVETITATKANDTDVLHKTGDLVERITGAKTFIEDITIERKNIVFTRTLSTDFYGLEWDNNDGFIKQLPTAAELRFSVGREAGWGGYMSFYTDTSEKMRLLGNGNLGIGTITPDVFSRSYDKILGISSSGQSAIEINSASGGAYFDFGIAGSRKLGIVATNTDAAIATIGAIPLVLGYNSTNKVVVNSDGITVSGTVKASDGVANNDAATVGQLAGKQATLVSGSNIKTVNGTTLLGSGNLAVGNIFDGGQAPTSRLTIGTTNAQDVRIIANNQYVAQFGQGALRLGATAIRSLTDKEVIIMNDNLINPLELSKTSDSGNVAFRMSRINGTGPGDILEYRSTTTGAGVAGVTYNGQTFGPPPTADNHYVNKGSNLEGVLTKTANYTITSADYGNNGVLVIYADASAGPITIELEAATAMYRKMVKVIKTDASANSVTLKGNGTTLINDSNTLPLTGKNQNATLHSNNTQYYIF